ncbi:MAG: sodium:solute symporter family transporter [Candidatus Zixiibacteriota bacterium]
MVSQILILSAYFIVILIIGFIARTKLSASPNEYFLSGRNLSGILLIGTMIATNFSAFTVYGTSGAGYRDGYSFFPIMGFGTGFMALSFWVIGKKAWKIAKDKNLISPPELIGELYGNRLLNIIFAFVMIIFTIPYLALQPMAAGYVLQELFGIEYFTGCIIVTAIILLYTLRGGMKAVVWTDLLQGSLMFILLFISIILVSRHNGGFISANRQVFHNIPILFSRPGASGKYLPGIWLGFMALWFFADPMFPQLFQRFFSAKNEKSLAITMLAYPAISSLIFFMPISMGVLGHLTHPGLSGKAADKIIPMMLNDIAGPNMATLVMAAGIAALMSTMDSQLLTLGSIFSRDIAPIFGLKNRKSSIMGRIFVIILAFLGLALAYNPPDTILAIATEAFSGLAMLFPAIFFGLYLKKRYSMAAILSILSGEIMVILLHFKIITMPGVLPFLPSIAVAIIVYCLAHIMISVSRNEFELVFPRWLKNPFIIIFAGIFILANDFWRWNDSGQLWFGLPSWIFWFIGLSAVQTIAMWLMIKTNTSDVSHEAD